MAEEMLEQMKAGQFDEEMARNGPDPPEIDQMKKDQLYNL